MGTGTLNMLQIVLWKWEQPGTNRVYWPEHVNVMCAMLRRNLVNTPHRIICVTDNYHGISECEIHPLWNDMYDLPNATGKHLPSCYRRLKLYDRATQKDMGIDKGDRIMGIDLDTLITGDLRPVIETQGEFVGWHLRRSDGKFVFNGSLQMFTAGTLQEIWSGFNPAKSPKEAFNAGFRGSDQSWISYKLCDKPGAVGLVYPLVSSYPLQNRIMGELKSATRVIFFHGSQKPWDPQARLNSRWIDRYWRL
jgi:hypothetical protein